MEEMNPISVPRQKSSKWLLGLIIFFIIIVLVLFIIYENNSSKFKGEIINQGCIDKNCSPLIISSNEKTTTIDVLFIPADIYFGEINGTYYENLSKPLVVYNQREFLKDVNKSINELFSLDPYSKYKDKFNFYYYKKSVRQIVKNGMTFGELNNKSIDNFNPGLLQLGNFDLYIIISPVGAGGLGGGAVIQTANVSKVIVHEISHFFGLQDEDFAWTEKDIGKSTNICGDFSCCGGKLCEADLAQKCLVSVCEKEETGECCIPNTFGSVKYTVPYAELMKYGPRQKLFLSIASAKVVDYSISHWKDNYDSQFEPELNKTLYYPDGSRLGKIFLENI